MRKPILASPENGETESEGEAEAEADGYGYRYGDGGEGEDGDGDGHEDDEERETRLSSESCPLSIALKELRSIKFHLYSAAEFCEATYMSSTQKKTVYDNLKEYSVKAILNAVDHFNTVAFKIDETFSQCVNDITVLQVNTSSLARRLSLFHGTASYEGLKHYRCARRRPMYSMHYTLSGSLSQSLSNGPLSGVSAPSNGQEQLESQCIPRSLPSSSPSFSNGRHSDEKSTQSLFRISKLSRPKRFAECLGK